MGLGWSLGYSVLVLGVQRLRLDVILGHMCQKKCRRLCARTDPTRSDQLRPHVQGISPMIPGSILPVAEGRASLCSSLPSIRLFANNLRSRCNGAASQLSAERPVTSASVEISSDTRCLSVRSIPHHAQPGPHVFSAVCVQACADSETVQVRSIDREGLSATQG